MEIKPDEQIDGDWLLGVFACLMIIGSVFYFWIWPLIKNFVLEG